jgi:predicted RNA-binding Zn-ribbon protein involved in translation (DUF1610 family)
MTGKMNWDRTRYTNKPTEVAMPIDDRNLVTIRCRKCGHLGKIRRWQAENNRMKCSQCGWRGGRTAA